MTHRIKAAILGVTLTTAFSLIHTPAFAQSAPQFNNVVVACGTVNGAAYTVNTNRPATIDTTGKSCNNTISTGATFAPTQLTLSTSAGLVLAAGTFVSRQVCNADATIMEYVGDSSVTSSTGIKVPPGACWDASHSTAAIYMVSASATPIVSRVQY